MAGSTAAILRSEDNRHKSKDDDVKTWKESRCRPALWGWHSNARLLMFRLHVI